MSNEALSPAKQLAHAKSLLMGDSPRKYATICVLGALAGLAAVMFHEVTMKIEAWTVAASLDMSHVKFAFVSFGWVVGGSLLASLLIKFVAPEAGGGGILPTKITFWQDFGFMKARVFVTKFIASAVTLGTGTSLGPEGPAVQIGAGVMSSGAELLQVPKQGRRAYCAGGAAAGLAAAFNAPLAAVTFVLEEIIGDLNSRYLGTVVLAAVMGALVVHAILGAQPSFQAPALTSTTWVGYLMSIPVAAFAAAAGSTFQRGSMWLRARSRKWVRIPGGLAPVVGAVLCWIIACSTFLATGHSGVFGIGYQDVTLAIGGTLPWTTAVVLFLGKLAATIAAVGTSGCGGIFAPSFFIGAMAGKLLAGLSAHLVPLSSSDQTMLVMVGMCACLGAVIRTPIACILMIFEVTHQFMIVPALLIATMVSLAVAKSLQHAGLYEAMLEQDGVDPNRLLPPRHFKQWREMPVSAIATYRPVVATDLSPEGLKTLLASSKKQRFPVMIDGKLKGVLWRHDAEIALQSGKPPEMKNAVWLSPKTAVGDSQEKFLETDADMLCVGDEATGELIGVLTLHDILRGQDALVEEA